MFWFHEFHFLSVAYLFRGVLNGIYSRNPDFRMVLHLARYQSEQNTELSLLKTCNEVHS